MDWQGGWQQEKSNHCGVDGGGLQAFENSQAPSQRKVDRMDNVDKCSIILYGFELTKTNRLRKITVDALKSLYNKLCS